ncbi:hypothetical protein NDU88_003889 [Pleurodeles waltl]|uniref:Uncharacterized protein n=1 Tax=Pleurodeles waltl TaxID=8319 RepID=A0AAV7W3E3_PLEWA|nr:hypothetical protein NDU88_003889 [Pleurodeles waltl]
MFVFGRPWSLAIYGAAGTRSHDDVLLIGRYLVSTARGKPRVAAGNALQGLGRDPGLVGPIGRDEWRPLMSSSALVSQDRAPPVPSCCMRCGA